jgi:Uma2 family endonuclease
MPLTIAQPKSLSIPVLDRQPKPSKWRYEDWLHFPDDGNRYEIIDGELYVSPPPLIGHQRSSLSLVLTLATYVKKKNLGEVLFAPVGVRLPTQPVPVEPDILFVQQNRLHIIGRNYVEGAPDLIVEILSSNWRYDRGKKMQAYQEAGVKEYWIVDPRAKVIEVYTLIQGKYHLAGKYATTEVAKSKVVQGFEVAVADLF